MNILCIYIYISLCALLCSHIYCLINLSASAGPIVEDVLTSRLAAKLMRYLRVRVLGEMNTSQRDSGHLTENKNVSGAFCIRGREESRSKARQVLETTHFDDSRITDEKSLDDQSVERDQERSICGQAFGEECWLDGRDPPDDADGENMWHTHDSCEGKTKFVDFDENGRDDSSRRKLSRVKTRGKGRATEGSLENEQGLTSPGSGSRVGSGRTTRDRSSSKSSDVKRVLDAKKFLGRNTSDVHILERGDNDDCFQGCRVGTKDFSDLVRKAVRAAEAEARAANAPEEAIRAAGDDAAEVVKSAALEVCRVALSSFFLSSCTTLTPTLSFPRIFFFSPFFLVHLHLCGSSLICCLLLNMQEFKTTNNEEAAVLAASKVASTVVDAANATEVIR